jgi:hypothetical protein
MKTLKDLVFENCDAIGNHWMQIDPETIHQAAIEWVKKLYDDNYDYDEWAGDKLEAASWIKHFFNLTKDDLK